ncbi:unnamed protein product [Caenorhabditis bovis]|uniref:Uncharacterized protein n=1 Tax=Caenorhabditis bovis TaxID=2654633 RepID=A0A8S1EJX8_9PELO|nr:unnamed protein product [Caenorhabditis bovis]
MTSFHAKELNLTVIFNESDSRDLNYDFQKVAMCAPLESQSIRILMEKWMDTAKEKKCDSDTSTCLPGYTYGLCCDTAQLDAYSNDMLAECPNGLKLRYTDPALPWYAHDMRVVAKSCDVLQCPAGYHCHTGLHFAYCCPN